MRRQQPRQGPAWAAGQGGSGTAQPCLCELDQPQPGEAPGGPCRTPFRGRRVTWIGSQEAWEGDGLGQVGLPPNSLWGWGSQAALAGVVLPTMGWGLWELPSSTFWKCP